MTFNKLLEDITSYVNEYRDFEYKTYKSNEDRQQDDEYMKQLSIVLHEELSTYLVPVTEAIENLQKISVKENYYFFDCAFKVYENHYKTRKEGFIKDHIDVNEADFIKEELISRLDARMNRRLKWGRGNYFYNQFIHSDNKLYSSELKKREFLSYKLELLGWDALLVNDEDGASYYRFEKNNNYQPSFQSNVNTEIMNSSNFSNYIAETILKFQEFSSKEGELLAQKKDSMFSDALEEKKEALSKRNEEFEIKLIADQKKISELLKQLYYKSAEDNFYWFDCPLQVYSENLEANFKKYKKEYLDDNIEDFLKEEVSKFSNFNKHRNLNYKNEKVDYSSFIGFSNKVFEKSRGKKLKFLNEKLKENNIQIADFNSYKIRGETTLVPKYDYKEPKAENSLPIPPKSNLVSKEQKTEKQLTSNQIVLLLDKIGFFTYPKIENTSKVKQAEVISKITGLNDKNIKTKIQNLEKLPKELGTQHQKDIDKIDAILDNLE